MDCQGIKTNQIVVFLLGLMILALSLDTFFFTGFMATADDNCYLLAAHNIAHNIKPLCTIYTEMEQRLAFLRLGITIPMALVNILAKGRIFWIAYSFILLHLFLLIQAFFMGVLLHGRKVGMIAAFMAATCPLYISWAGVAVPDLALAFWTSAVLLILIYVHKHRQHLWSAQGRWFPLLALAGFLCGLAYSTKESALVILVPAALFLGLAAPRLLSLQTLRMGLYFVCGFVVYLSLETIIIQYLCGQYLFRLDVILEAKGSYLRLMQSTGVWPWQRALTVMAGLAPYMPFSRWSLLAAVLIYPWLKNTDLLTWIYCVWFVLFLTFGSTSLSEYVPPPVQARYFIPAMLPAFVFVAHCLITLQQYLCKKTWRLPGGLARWATGLIVGLLVLTWIGDTATHTRLAGEMGRANQVRSFLKALAYAKVKYPDMPIVVSPSISDRMLGMFLQDTGGVIISNRWYSVFNYAIPQPPFVLIEEPKIIQKTGVQVDLPVRQDQRLYHVKAKQEIFSGLSRYEALVQGDWLLGLNPILASKGEKTGYRSSLVLLIDR